MAWDDILGHKTTKQIFQTHLAANRVAHAYLLAGPEGIGKRLLALEMAKALNCLDEERRPCDVCGTCRQINRLAHPDVHVLVPGGASGQIRIDDLRHLLGRIALRPYNARFQVALIDGADRLTEEAANSVLKALEEPPAHTRFLLLAARLSDCLPTIISRCQVLRCAPLPLSSVTQLLAQQHSDPARVSEAASLADGSLSSAQQLLARWDERQRTLARLADRTGRAWFDTPLPETREAVADLLGDMMEWIRDIAAAAVDERAPLRHAAHREAVRKQARSADLDRCLELGMELVSLRESLAQFISPRLVAALAREKWLDTMAPITAHA